MLRKMILGAVALVALFAAPAAAQYGFIVTPGTVVEGSNVSVSGRGCAPGATVQITFKKAPDTATTPDPAFVVKTGTADSSGNFNFTFMVPAGTPPGTYDVSAFCGGQLVGRERITVEAATTATTVAVGNLPRTGTDITPMAMAGAGLLTAGGLFLLAGRKRRRATA